IAAHDALVHAHGAIKGLAASLNKIANDIRLLASGPRSGLGEISLPENEPGSSIMPGKTNPTQCESLSMICLRVFGNDATIGFAGASGHLELNTYKPLIISTFLESVRLLTAGVRGFNQFCIVGLVPVKERIQHHLDQSLMMATALAPHIGYDRTAKIARLAQTEGLTLREAALREGQISESEFDRWVNPRTMI
ncbi:MAG: class II fumarate hydratase, partial [Proteobacteria bacterium]